MEAFALNGIEVLHEWKQSALLSGISFQSVILLEIGIKMDKSQ
jgi:hypothetical protein